MNKTLLTDKEVIKILSRTSERAYKYGTLKPKIDELMKDLSDKLEKEYQLKIEAIKKDLITSIKEIK
jgi:Holliday junction resolvase RusA-like endonuclease